MTKLLVGTDPEFMLFNPKTGAMKSAIGVIKGTKQKKVEFSDGSSTFPDNVNVEVNIPPAGSEAQLVTNVKNTFYNLAQIVRPYQITLTASTEYPKSECEHPDAQVFGCEPEFDAYEISIVQAPNCTTTFRSAGGHIHLGYEDEVWPLKAPMGEDNGYSRAWGKVWVVRMMDLFMGIPSLWLDHDPSSPARRKLYGNAGTHRPKDYGVEYRPTGNFWLRSPQMVKLIYQICSFTVDFVAKNKHLELWSDENTCKGYNADDLKTAINTSNKKLAGKFLNGVVKKYLPDNIYSAILTESEPTKEKLTCSATWADLSLAWGL